MSSSPPPPPGSEPDSRLWRLENEVDPSGASRWAAAAAASAEQDEQDEQESLSSSSSHRGLHVRAKSQRSKNQRTKMKRKGLAALEAAALGGASSSALATNIRDMERQHGVSMRGSRAGAGAAGGGRKDTGVDDLERMHNKHASLELHELAEENALQKSSNSKGKANVNKSPSPSPSPSSSSGGGLGIVSPEDVRNRANFLLGLDTTRGPLDNSSRQQLIHGSLPDRHVSFGDTTTGSDRSVSGQGGRAASLARAAGRASAKLSHKLRRDINNRNQPSGDDGSHSTYFDDEYDFAAPSASRLRNSRFNMADEELGIDIAPTRARFIGKRPKLAVAGTLLLAAVVAFAYNVFGGGGGNAGGDSSSSGGSEEQQLRLYEIRQRIRDAGMKDAGDIDCLSQPPTPQCKAVNWLALKDPMKVATDDEFLLQRYALACFWYSTFGLAEDTEGHDDAELHYWTEHNGWMTGAGLCAWQGILCRHKPGSDPKEGIRTYDDNNQVTHFRLPLNSIRGTVPDEVFYHLTEMRQLDLSDNSVTGTMPASIGRLKSLQYLYLYNSKSTSRADRA